MAGVRQNDKELLKAVRHACLEAATAAYEDAGIQGLCAEGRWECARDAIRTVDLTSVVKAEYRRPTAECRRPDLS